MNLAHIVLIFFSDWYLIFSTFLTGNRSNLPSVHHLNINWEYKFNKTKCTMCLYFEVNCTFSGRRICVVYIFITYANPYDVSLSFNSGALWIQNHHDFAWYIKFATVTVCVLWHVSVSVYRVSNQNVRSSFFSRKLRWVDPAEAIVCAFLMH